MSPKKLAQLFYALERAAIDLLYKSADLETGAKGTKELQIAASVVFALVMKLPKESGGGGAASGQRMATAKAGEEAGSLRT